MLEILAYCGYVVMALLGFGFVIAIHEFGHFVFAKWAGVKVERFSIGFPPAALGIPLKNLRPLWSRQWGETLYLVDWLPLGGYVKMVGQEDAPTGEAAGTETDPRSYLAKSAPWKAGIMVGGVLFNLISSYLILIALAAWGMPVFHPVVGDVEPQVIDQDGRRIESPAARLGLKRGDRLVEVDGEKVRSFDDVMTAVIFAGGRPLELKVERGGQVLALPAPGAAPVEPVFDGRFGRPSLGIGFPWSNRVVLAVDVPPGGVERFDRVVAVAGEDVSRLIGQDIQDRLMRHFGREVAVTLERGGVRREVRLVYAGDDTAFEVRAGVPIRIEALTAGGPAAAAGLRLGDWLLAVDGVPVSGYQHFLALCRAGLDAQGGCLVAVQRDGERIEVRIEGADSFGVKRLGISPRPVYRGVLAVLPPAPGGGASALAAAGLVPGDALVQWQSGEASVDIAWVSGGQALRLPLGLDEAAWREANLAPEPGLLAKIFGGGPPPGLAAQLASAKVLEKRADALVLRPLSGPERTVPAARLGPAFAQLQAGDWLIEARLGAEGAVLEAVRSAGEPKRATLAPPPLGTTLLFEREELPYQATGWGDRLDLVNDAAYNLVVKGVLILPRLFRKPQDGGVDANKSLMGPIGIFREMKARAELMGFDSFLKLVALVGLNLFVVNLLPIPITDGGQLLMLGVECAIRRPLPIWLRNGLMYAGIALVGALFIYICGLDILRLIGIA